jgi:hypothetical protein
MGDFVPNICGGTKEMDKILIERFFYSASMRDIQK